MENKKESAWKDNTPEDVTGKQRPAENPSKDDPAKQEKEAVKKMDQPTNKGPQGNTNKAMGNAANRPPQDQQQSKQSPRNQQRSGLSDEDADQMGSGKRQDDN